MKSLIYMFLGFGLGFNTSGILIPDVTFNILGTISLALGIVSLFVDEILNVRKITKHN